MTPRQALVREIEHAVVGRNPAGAAETLSRVAGLFTARSPRIEADRAAVLDGLVPILAEDLGTMVRARLAERAGAPRRVPAFREEDLVEIAMTKGQEHLRALSRGKLLTAPAAGGVAGRGDEDARLAPGGCAAPVRPRGLDEAILSTRGIRDDLPADVFARLLAAARDRAGTGLGEELGGAPPGSVDGVLDEVAGALEDEAQGASALSRYEASFAALQGRAPTRPPGEAEIERWLALDRTEDALAALAVVGAMPVALAVRAYFCVSFHPLLIVVRVAGCGWPTFQLLLGARWRSRIPAEVAAAASAAFDRPPLAAGGRTARFSTL